MNHYINHSLTYINHINKLLSSHLVQVDIEPLLGRVVMFRSRAVWHGILESKVARRWAVTLWVLAEDSPAD